jgi:hypothetical protein
MSTLKADTIQSTSGGAATLTKQQAPKMWTSANQSTAAIRDSLNTSSITDNSTGNFTNTATSALANANYAISGTNVGDTQGNYALNVNSAGDANTTTTHRYSNFNTVNDNFYDAATISTVVQGDLA